MAPSFVEPVVVVQSLSCVWLFAILWIAECQAPLPFTIFQSLLRLMRKAFYKAFFFFQVIFIKCLIFYISVENGTMIFLLIWNSFSQWFYILNFVLAYVFELYTEGKLLFWQKLTMICLISLTMKTGFLNWVMWRDQIVINKYCIGKCKLAWKVFQLSLPFLNT